MFDLLRSRVAVGTAALVACVGLLLAMAHAVEPPDPQKPGVQFSSEGKLKQPVGYRKWVYVGTPLTPHDLNDGEATFPEFHSL